MSRSNSLWGFLSRKVEKQKKSPAVHTLGLATLLQNHIKFKMSPSPKLNQLVDKTTKSSDSKVYVLSYVVTISQK